MDNDNVNSAILERVERVVEALQDNSVKMGELLAVHNEKLDKQDMEALSLVFSLTKYQGMVKYSDI